MRYFFCFTFVVQKVAPPSRASLVEPFSDEAFGRAKKIEKLELKHLKEPYQTCPRYGS
jgi:hypothetical protein